jgi:hypothetical protein
MRYLINVFKKSTAKNFLGWGLYDVKNDTHYRLEIGIDNGFTMLNGRDKAIETLAATIYFGDNSDYKSGLWEALRALSPSIAEDLENKKWRPEDEGGA